MAVTHLRPNMDNWQERMDLAAAFRWTARLNYHEAVANHFSLAVNEDGTRFLMNPNQSHFSRIKASDIIEIDANNPDTLSGPDAPDPTAWGLHGSLHRNCPHARCMCIQSTQQFWHPSKTADFFQSIKTVPLFTIAM